MSARQLASTLAICAATLLALGAASALGVPRVTLHAGFNPERLGASTTLNLRIQVAPGSEPIPPPLVHAELRYPAGLDVQLSGLGIEACTAQALETAGIGACPPDSVMGEGQAIAEFLIAHHIVREVASLTAVRTTEREGHLTMLLYLYDETAVSAQLILTSQLLPAGGPFAGLVDIQIPLVQSLPGTPDVSVSEIQLGLGPETLTYSEKVGRQGRPLHPRRDRPTQTLPPRGVPFRRYARVSRRDPRQRQDGRGVSGGGGAAARLARVGKRAVGPREASLSLHELGRVVPVPGPVGARLGQPDRPDQPNERNEQPREHHARLALQPADHQQTDVNRTGEDEAGLVGRYGTEQDHDDQHAEQRRHADRTGVECHHARLIGVIARALEQSSAPL